MSSNQKHPNWGGYRPGGGRKPGIYGEPDTAQRYQDFCDKFGEDCELAHLPPKQQWIIRQYYGIGCKALSLGAIAANHGVFRQSIHTTKKFAEKKLTKKLGKC